MTKKNALGNNKHTKRTIGTNIRDLRLALNLTQQQFSDATGLNQAQLSRFELDKHTPSIPTLTKIARILKVPVNELMKGI